MQNHILHLKTTFIKSTGNKIDEEILKRSQWKPPKENTAGKYNRIGEMVIDGIISWLFSSYCLLFNKNIKNV